MRILVIGAHADDEVLGAGGIMKLYSDAGHEVHVCIVCDRVKNHEIVDDVVKANILSADKIKNLLGIKSYRFLGLKEEIIDSNVLDVIIPLEAVIDSVKPDIVFTHHGGDLNQDHRIVFDASLIATRPISKHTVKTVYSYETISSTEQPPNLASNIFLPNYFVDIEKVLEDKIAAMRLYDGELCDFPHPRSPHGIRVHAENRGIQSGFKAAESFYLLRTLEKTIKI